MLLYAAAGMPARAAEPPTPLTNDVTATPTPAPIVPRISVGVQKAAPIVPTSTPTPIPLPPTRDYGENVMRWAPTVARYFPPELVDKALYVMSLESGGNDQAISKTCDYGLFQMNRCGGVGTGIPIEDLLDGEFNIRQAAATVAADGWGHWGEGRLYRGEPFGALGHHPYPGPP